MNLSNLKYNDLKEVNHKIFNNICVIVKKREETIENINKNNPNNILGLKILENNRKRYRYLFNKLVKQYLITTTQIEETRWKK